MNAALLSVENLAVEFATSDGPVAAVRDVNLQVLPQQCVGVVGESGSGKSVTALTILRLLPPRARVLHGRIMFEGSDVLRLPERELERMRGRRLSLVPQDPMTALNPSERVGGQLVAALRAHRGLSRVAAREASTDALAQVGITDPAGAVRRFPHQLSGGQRQRVVIAIALAGDPQLLIADEATTALDVTTQRQILTLLRQRADVSGLSLMFITHDLGVLAAVCDYAYVMRDGLIVEHGPVADVLDRPSHPYTAELLEAFPDPDQRQALGA